MNAVLGVETTQERYRALVGGAGFELVRRVPSTIAGIAVRAVRLVRSGTASCWYVCDHAVTTAVAPRAPWVTPSGT